MGAVLALAAVAIVIIAIAIAIAPYILPLLGWLLAMVALLTVIGFALWLAAQIAAEAGRLSLRAVAVLTEPWCLSLRWLRMYGQLHRPVYQQLAGGLGGLVLLPLGSALAVPRLALGLVVGDARRLLTDPSTFPPPPRRQTVRMR
ncbi:MAG TPA: hypothetical protein VFJ50_09235 [Gemmatimonadales bacterium]|nr:hypothetical protein [Gemmatimonadales bacterium]